jgi:hypothetical protein
VLDQKSNTADGTQTHGICPRCLLSVLEQLETIASSEDRLLPVATWLIVVAADDPLLLQELQQRFSRSSLVRVIGDRRAPASRLGSPHDRRDLASSRDHDQSSYGFFVVHQSGRPPAPDAVTP